MKELPSIPPWPMLSVLHVAGGGCGGCGLEVVAMRRLHGKALAAAGLRMVDAPRHADLLLVSGCVAANVEQAVAAAWAAMAEPKFLVAVGSCALDGGPFAGSYAVRGGIGTRLPVAAEAPGCPPAPSEILATLVQLADALRDRSPVSPAAEETVVPDPLPPAPPGLPPAALRHPLEGGDSSAG